ncbi:MAG: hypothetical protein PHQ43_05005 [Dehalococcoidales bacterium]|nr:hypothetical protein [Dehalococcoidales bacterium]
MAAPGDRFKSWMESLSDAWKERMRGWAAGTIGFGFEIILDILGKKSSQMLKPTIEAMEKMGNVPPELKPLIDEMKNPTGEASAVLGAVMKGGVINRGLSGFMDALFEPYRRLANRTLRPTMMATPDIIQSWQRGKKSFQQMILELTQHGYTDDAINCLFEMFQVRFPSDVVGPAWLRDPAKYEKYWNDVHAIGVSPDRVEMLKEMAYKVATVQDIIQFVVKEVYSPEIAEKFGQFEDYPVSAEEDARKAGIRPDLLRKYWAAHWDLPAVTQGFEMLHRGIIDQETLMLLLRSRDVMPYWREKLIQISYNPYTRVDARRMWDMGVLDDEELLRTYKDLGYDDEHARKMTIWTKVYVMYPQLIARYKNGWISAEQVLQELVNLGLTQEKAQWMYETKFKIESAARTTAEKDLTMAQIIKGVKRGKITRVEAAVLLTDLGYDDYEAQFILDIEIPVDETEAAVKARELTKADILAGLKSETINLDQAREKLLELRYLQADADFILKVYTDSIKPPAEPAGKSLTKADIVSAVKKGLVTPEQAFQLLINIGYNEADANFILALQAEESPFSPINYDEFKQLTGSWRRAQGFNMDDQAPEVDELKLQKARAIAEGKNPMLEQQRIQIDTIRRKRRKGLITRSDEERELKALNVPEDYIRALVENDDIRLANKQE